MIRNIVLLGFGFTAKAVYKSLSIDHSRIFVTSRKSALKKDNSINFLYFDLEDESSYSNIPHDSDLIWFFPAVNLDKIKKFYQFISKINSKVRFVFGTTSSYLDRNGIITEDSFLNLDRDRVKGEMFFKFNGSVILQASGLYGYEKHPYKWLNKGLIKNSNKSVNLIHVDDISYIVRLLLKYDISNEIINLCDGKKYIWKDLWKKANKSSFVDIDCPPSLEKIERFVSNEKLVSIIGSDYKFKSLHNSFSL